MRFSYGIRYGFALLCLVLAAGCNGEESQQSGEDVLDTQANEQDIAAYNDMFDSILAYLRANSVIIDGNWEADFGDASFYGPAFDYAHYLDTQDPYYLERATATADFVVLEIERSIDDLSYLMERLDDTSMGLLGLIEMVRMGVGDEYRDAALAMLEKANGIARAFNYYVAGSIDNYAVNTYGPTVVTALLALMNFQWVVSVDHEDNPTFLDTGITIIETIHEKTWDPQLQAYRYAPENERLYLYPNIIMIVALNRAFEFTGDGQYLDRAEALFEAIQPLKDEECNCYYTPYSADVMGAQTEDYHSFSPHNYLMLALVLTYQNTGNPIYLTEAYSVLDFIASTLYVDGQVLHHWMDGRLALPTDLEYYCPGCNLQLLYMMHYIRDIQ